MSASETILGFKHLAEAITPYAQKATDHSAAIVLLSLANALLDAAQSLQKHDDEIVQRAWDRAEQGRTQ